MKIETKCLHAGYTPKNGEPNALPIYQSTTYRYESTEFIGKLFDLTAEGHMYSRISNPTVCAVEDKIAALEGGVGGIMYNFWTGSNYDINIKYTSCWRPLSSISKNIWWFN